MWRIQAYYLSVFKTPHFALSSGPAYKLHRFFITRAVYFVKKSEFYLHVLAKQSWRSCLYFGVQNALRNLMCIDNTAGLV